MKKRPRRPTRRKSKRKRYRFGPSKSRPGTMMLVVHRDKKKHIHCACGRDHGDIDEHKATFAKGNLLFESWGIIERDHHAITHEDVELGDGMGGTPTRILKVACVCGMRARFLLGGPTCDDPKSCHACGKCVACACCACRDENPFGSYR